MSRAVTPAGWIVVGLVAWVAVSVPVGLAVGAAISQREQQEQTTGGDT